MTSPDAEHLSAYIDARHARKHPAATSADEQFVARLMDLTSEAQPDAPFVETLGQRLAALDRNEERPMTTIALSRKPMRMTWAAALIALVLLGGLVLALWEPGSIRLQPAAPPAALMTATPPAPLDDLPFYIPVGGVTTNPEMFDRMVDIGMRWAMLPVEYRADERDALLNEASIYIAAARERGMRVLVSLYGNAAEISAAQANDYADIAAFAAGLTSLGVSAIEVWPEANISLHWPQGKIGGASYAELLRAVASAVRGVYPNILVISGAPAPTVAESTFPGRIVNDDTFYLQMTQAGIGDVADCVGVHYVEGVLPPQATSGDPRTPNEDPGTRYFVSMLQRAAMPFRTAASLRASSIPVCVTELGYASPEGIEGGMGEAFAWANETSVEEQGQWLAEAINTAASLSSIQVSMVMVFRVDAPSDDPVQQGYAIVRPDGSCAACEELVKLQRQS
jgi:hypothetical protein